MTSDSGVAIEDRTRVEAGPAPTADATASSPAWALGLDQPPSLRPSLLVVLLIDVFGLGVWASWTVVHDRALRGIVLAAFLSAPFIAVVVARPVSRRLAMNRVRRGVSGRWTIVVSVAFATALTTMAVVTLDALSHAATTATRSQLGAVDELIIAPRPEARTAAQELIASAMVDDDATGRVPTLGESIDGQLALTTLVVRARLVSGPPVDVTAIEIDVPTVQQSASGGPGSDTSGFAGQQPLGAGHVLLGQDLAADLGAVAGSEVSFTIGDAPTTMRVDAVLPRRGIAALSVDGTPRPRVAFVAPGLLTTLATADHRPRYLLAISNRGDADHGGDLSELVTARLEELLGPNAISPDPVAGDAADRGPSPESGSPTEGVTVVAAKRDLQRRVEREVGPLRALFAALSATAIAVSGVFLALLIGQLVTRRRREIVALRLIGVGRLDVAAAVGVEAWMAALVGVASGSIVGYLIAATVGRAATTAASSRGVGLAYRSTWPSAVVGGSVGLALAVIAIIVPLAVLSRRHVLADLNGDSGRPSSPSRHRRFGLFAALGFLLGLVELVRGLRHDRAVDAVLGAALAAFAGIAWARVRRPTAATLVTAITAGFAAVGVVLVRWLRPGLVDTMGAAGFAALAILGLSSTTLLSDALGRPFGVVVERIVRRFSNRHGTPAGQRAVAEKAGAAVQRSQPVRTMLFSVGFAAMFFLLAASWTLGSTLDARIAADVAAVRGGWDVIARADSADPGAQSALSALPDVADVAGFTARTVTVAAATARETASVTAFGIDAGYVDHGPARLARRSAGAADDRAVYAAVLDDPSLVIVDPAAFPRGASAHGVQPGDVVFVSDPQTGRSVAVTVAGTLRSGIGLAPVFANRSALDGFGTTPSTADRFVIHLAGNDTAAWLARNRSAFAGSLRTFDAAARSETAAPRQLLSLLWSFVGASALLCLMALSSAAAEQVRRRQREFATLRSLGLRRSGLRAAVLAPTIVQVADAAFIGSALGVLGAANLVRSGVLGPASIHVPWVMLVLATVVAVGVAVAAAWRPAAKAADMAPMRAMA